MRKELDTANKSLEELYDKKRELESRGKFEELSQEEKNELGRIDNNILKYNKESNCLRNKLSEIKSLKEVFKDPELSIKDKLTILFKRNGVTILSLATAIGLIITTIAVATGVKSPPVSSNGGSAGSDGPVKAVVKKASELLKWLGNKAAAILPGIIGSVVSFVLKTAGQVVGFIAEHVWLLATAIAIYIFDKLIVKRKK